MTTYGFVKKRKRDKPANYYRSGLTRNDFRRAMDGCGPLSVTQIAAMLSDLVPPESKARYAEMQHPHASVPIELRLHIGMRRIVQLRMRNLISDNKVAKRGSGKEATYEWIEAESNSPKVNPPGRGHAVKGRAKRGRNQRVRRANGGRG